MTSLIFGSIYLSHKGIINHRREKQRQKNYERWEGLRDEYDEQRKISRESRSLDIQRTGADYNNPDADRPILTLRDQQEANDARTSWRPQEAWDDPAPERRASVEVTSGNGLRPLANNKTGSTWDEGLPQPLRVSRRNWDDYAPPVSRSSSLRHASTPNTTRDRSGSNSPSINNNSSSHLDLSSPTSNPSHTPTSRSTSMPAQMMQQQTVEPIEHATPGGRMAELIEFGDEHRPAQSSAPVLAPVPYSPQSPQFYGGYPTQHYSPPMPAPQANNDGSMQEWWNRP